MQQMLMICWVKDGLFRRVVTDSKTYTWIKSVIFTKDIIEIIEEFCNISFENNFETTQLIDAMKLGIKRDMEDFKKLEEYFK